MQIAFEGYDPEDERRREALFALGNGVIAVRGCPPEAEAADEHHYPGTYHAGCYDQRLVCADAGEIGHASLVNLPNADAGLPSRG